MRRKVTLYIGGERCDLSSQSVLLLNYTQEDASNPTAVVAPYSQQVTLPGTSANNRIFGDMWRPDRTTAEGAGWTGAGFDALKKTPFDLYADTGEILQSGYVRLDSVDRRGNRVTYKVTLFGGVASLFYGLSYNDDGTEMSLADLDYTDDGGDAELDFRITAANVLAAWADLGTGADPVWRVINFAPAYEGIPDKDFDATKAVVDPANVGLTSPLGAYDTKGGKCLVTLPQAVDAWAVKDLRSYLQRPVVNFGHVLRAIVRKAAQLGYTLDLSTLASSMGYFGVDGTNRASAMWLTLPLLTSIALRNDPSVTLTKTATPKASNPVATWAVGGSTPSGTKMAVTIRTRIQYTVPDSSGSLTLWYNRLNDGRGSAVFFRLYGYAGGTEVARSKIYCFAAAPTGRTLTWSPYEIMNLFFRYGGQNPYAEDEFYPTRWNIRTVDAVDPSTVELPRDIEMDLEGYDLDEVRLEVVKAGTVYWYSNNVQPTAAGDTGFLPPIYRNNTLPSVVPTQIYIGDGAKADTIDISTSSTVRSGAAVTKRMLLGSSHTPAQYLLSFAKMLGLYFSFDDATKAVTLHKRADFYNGPSVDLTKRIDRRSISLKPVAVDSKWYQFKVDHKGEFADEYEKTYGRTYGLQRVNTGYAFNDNVKDLISGSVLRGAVSALERSRYFNWIVKGGTTFVPSVFLDEGVKYTLWNAEGENLDTDVPIPAASSVVINYYNQNADLEGYDAEFANKLQLHDASGKGVEGEDILCFLEGRNTYEYFKVSDDDAAMHNITGGKGCWDLAPGDPDGLEIPIFQRYTFRAGNYNVDYTFDFGEPFALAFPRQIYRTDEVTLYSRAWKAYLRDRYDGDTKVMTCKVDLSGLRVDASLLRSFWWYEGATWVLNKISNYAPTAHAATECEFVQVQDKDAYINGQNFE